MINSTHICSLLIIYSLATAAYAQMFSFQTPQQKKEQTKSQLMYVPPPSPVASASDFKNQVDTFSKESLKTMNKKSQTLVNQQLDQLPAGSPPSLPSIPEKEKGQTNPPISVTEDPAAINTPPANTGTATAPATINNPPIAPSPETAPNPQNYSGFQAPPETNTTSPSGSTSGGLGIKY